MDAGPVTTELPGALPCVLSAAERKPLANWAPQDPADAGLLRATG